MSNFGLSGLPVVQAGQTDWQRPHSVQVAKSSICFQVKSSILKQMLDFRSDEQFRAERLARGPSRTDRLAASALGAGGEVQHLLPGEILHLEADAGLPIG